MAAAAAVYVAAGKFGLMLAYQFPSASPVWPPTGIALTLLLFGGFRLWPAILLGAFLVNVTTAGSIGTSIAIAIGNTLEGILGAFLIRRYIGVDHLFTHISGVLLFALIAVAVTTVSATVGVAALLLGGFAPWQSVGPMWLTWWLGDLTGALIVAPPLLLLGTQPWAKWSRARTLEAAALFLFVLLLGAVFFSHFFLPGSEHYPLAYMSLLPLLWSAIRFTPRETSVTAVLLSCVAIAGTILGAGPFAVADANTSLLFLQSFMAVASTIGLTLAASLQERRETELSLEAKVHERTRELVQSQEEERAHLQRLRSTIANLPMAALLMDEKGNILELNDAYCRMFHIGASPAQVIHMPQQELLARFLRGLLRPEEHMQKVSRMLDEKLPVLGQEILMKDGRFIQRDFIPIRENGAYRGQLFIYRDVTRERRVDWAKSEFMSLASHQLRTPLTALRWSLERLGKRLAGAVDVQDAHLLAQGRKAAVRMTETINTMLKISRIEAQEASVHMTEFALQDVFRDKEALLRPQYQAKGQSFSVECPADLRICTDPKCLREILANLLQNAVKYTPEGGRIRLCAREDGEGVLIEVEDTGLGIPMHQQQHVFRKFFRGDNVVAKDTDGTGLGLYLASLIAKALSGRITMRSEEGVGSTFLLWLPRGEHAGKRSPDRVQ